MRSVDQTKSAPYLLTHDKAQYDPLKQRVSLLTMHNSKGLEFNRVIIAGVGEGCSEDDQATEVRLLYIAMTRAMQNLLITSCKVSDLPTPSNRHMQTSL